MHKGKRRASVMGDSFCIFASLYVGLMFGIFPLVIHDGFFDITETKQIAFVVLSVLYLIAAVLILFQNRKKIEFYYKEDYFFLFLFAFYLICNIFSGHFTAAWIGADNRYQGILSYFLYFVIFLLLSRAKIAPKALGVAAATFGMVMLLAIVNHWGLDPLNTMDNLIPFDRGRYVSTIGNINFFGAYVCLFLPIVWMHWCQGKSRRKDYALFLLIVLGTCGAAAAKSEGTILGLVTAILIMPLFMNPSPEAFRRWPLLLITTLLSLQMFRLITGIVGRGQFSELMNFILNPFVSCSLLAVASGGHILLRKGEESRLLCARKWYLFSLGILVLLVLVLLLLMNTILADADLGILSRFFVLDSDWGSDRGKVWRACFSHWENMPVWQKIIGGGSGCLARLDRVNPVFKDAILDAAHNEFLHILLTNGLLGAGLYLAMNITLIGRSFQRESNEASALCIGIVGYLAQSCVNIAQPMTTPLYFIVLALLAGESRRRI